MKHKLSLSIRENRVGMGDDDWVEREREREEWNGNRVNKWLVYYNKRQDKDFNYYIA